MELVSLGVEVKTQGASQAAQQLGQFTGAAKGAAGAADALEDQLNGLKGAQDRVASGSKGISGAMSNVGQAFSRNAPAIQNASFQLQDIVVQMSMGVPAARTLGMQLPQLLGGFGPLGAVVGLAVGALLSFAPAAFAAGDSAASLTDTIDALDAAMQRLRSTQKGQSFDDLSKQYGDQASAARELLEIQKQIAELEATRAFGAAANAVVGALGPGLSEQSFASALNNAMMLNKALQEQIALEQMQAEIERGTLVLTDEQTDAYMRRNLENSIMFRDLTNYREALKDVALTFGISEQAAANLAMQMARVNEADTAEERAAATKNLATAIYEATGGLSMASDKGLELYNALVEAAKAGLELEGLDLQSGVAAAASSAAELAANLGVSLTTAQRMLQLGYAGNQPVIFDPRDPRYDEGAAMRASQFGFTYGTSYRPDTGVTTAKRGGGGSASSDAAEAQRLYDSTRTAAEKYAIETEKVQTLYENGAISSDVYSRALQDLNEQFDPMTKLVMGISSTVENELNNAFASVLDGTATLGDALLDFSSNVLQKVAQDLFAQQFSTPISQALTGVLSGVVGGMTAVPGSTAPPPRPFARGGVVTGATVFPFADGIGLMGEAGPEAIMPLSRGADGRLGIAANGSSAPRVTINNYSGQDATASTDGAGNLTIDIGRAVAQDITAGGPAYRAIKSTFGLANRLQQRG